MRRIRFISGKHTAVASGKLMCGREQSITRSASVEPALCSFPKPSDSGDGWTEENMAELEKELGLALEEEQGKSPPAGTPTSPSPRSVEAPQDETQSRERTETTGSRPAREMRSRPQRQKSFRVPGRCVRSRCPNLDH